MSIEQDTAQSGFTQNTFIFDGDEEAPGRSVKLCECGCGQPTRMIEKSNRNEGLVRGEYRRFVQRHWMRTKGRLPGGLKVCPVCREGKPETEEHFYPDNKRTSGLAVVCKECKRKHLDSDRKKTRAYSQRYKQKLKDELIQAYGGKCSCCGVSEREFLTLEHINRDGKSHRAKVGRTSVYVDLKRRGWPQEGFTILCWNCNCATRFGATCPHQRSTERGKSI